MVAFAQRSATAIPPNPPKHEKGMAEHDSSRPLFVGTGGFHDTAVFTAPTVFRPRRFQPPAVSGPRRFSRARSATFFALRRRHHNPLRRACDHGGRIREPEQ